MKIALVAGGTGGHIFPALAVSKKLQELDTSVEVVWITTNRSNEQELAKEYDIEMVSLNVEGIQRKISLQPIKATLLTINAFFKMISFLKKQKIDRVVAFGGYVCAPVLMAAKFLGIDYFIQEQNSVPGIVNRIFSKSAKKVFLGFPLADGFHLKGNCEITGNPIREKSIVQQIDVDTSNYRGVILITGGSQGAMSMNQMLIESVKDISQKNYLVIWQSGKPHFEEISTLFKDTENVIVFPTISNIYDYYAIANLLIARSGASTISEARAFQIPSIFIPLPWAAENHQYYNAQFAREEGWAYVIEQNKEGEQVLRDILVDDTIASLKTAFSHVEIKNSTEVISKEILDVE